MERGGRTNDTGRKEGIMDTEKEQYEGDYQCAAREDVRCRNVGTQVVKESVTPASYPVICCDECADGLEKAGYYFDEVATVQLARDREREAEMGVA
jgi:hypothetical protein